MWKKKGKKQMYLKTFNKKSISKKHHYKIKLTECRSSIYELNKILNRINFLNNTNKFKEEYLLQFINKRLNFYIEKKQLLKKQLGNI